MARCHRNAGQQLAQSSCSSDLVCGIDIGVQKDDRDRLNAGSGDCLSGSVEACHGKWPADITPCIHALDYFETQVSGHKGFRRFGMKVVEVGAVAAADCD